MDLTEIINSKEFNEFRATKIPTGISFFDQLAEGGFPKGQITVIAGKSNFHDHLTEFLIRKELDKPKS